MYGLQPRSTNPLVEQLRAQIAQKNAELKANRQQASCRRASAILIYRWMWSTEEGWLDAAHVACSGVNAPPCFVASPGDYVRHRRHLVFE